LFNRLLLLSLIITLVTGCSENTLSTDVIQNGDELRNVNKLDAFIQNSKNHKEDEIRIVRNYGDKSYGISKDKEEELEREGLQLPEGSVTYTLKYRYDKKSKQGWIEVKTDATNFKQSTTYSTSLADSQQCGYIRKDSERGYYMLTECFHQWEYELFPFQ